MLERRAENGRDAPEDGTVRARPQMPNNVAAWGVKIPSMGPQSDGHT